MATKRKSEKITRLSLFPRPWRPMWNADEHPIPPTGPIPDEIYRFSELEYLDLGGYNPAGDLPLPEELGRFRHLRTLDLRSSMARRLPDALGKLTNLRELWLDDNPRLTALPAGIGQLRKLQRLALNATPELRHLPKEIGRCTSLDYLHMTRAGLVDVPKALWDCSALESLVLPETLDALPPGISKLPKLGELVLSPNALLSIAKELPKMRSLEQLALTAPDPGARVRPMPDEVGRIPKLKSLLAGGSRMRVPDSLFGHPTLEVLDVLDNDVDTIVELVLSLPALRSVDCDEGNRIDPDELELVRYLLTHAPDKRLQYFAWHMNRPLKDAALAAKLGRRKERERLWAEKRKAAEAAKKARARARAGRAVVAR
jgi:Leucine-rich repeat (LRR) protein